jgi:hypothetical protein
MLARLAAPLHVAFPGTPPAAGRPEDLQPCRTLAPGTETALKPLPTSPLFALALAFGMVSHDDAPTRHVACRTTDVMCGFLLLIVI